MVRPEERSENILYLSKLKSKSMRFQLGGLKTQLTLSTNVWQDAQRKGSGITVTKKSKSILGSLMSNGTRLKREK